MQAEKIIDKARPGTLEVTMKIDTDNMAELGRILDHHIDYVIDMENNRDIISSVYGVVIKEIPNAPGNQIFNPKGDDSRDD